MAETKIAPSLRWQDVPDPWPMGGLSDVEAVTEIGTYTICADQPALGGTHYLWLAGNETDDCDSEHRTSTAAEAAALADYISRTSTTSTSKGNADG